MNYRNILIIGLKIVNHSFKGGRKRTMKVQSAGPDILKKTLSEY